MRTTNDGSQTYMYIQYDLFGNPQPRTFRSPFQYPGGKFYAYKQLSPHIPYYPEMVSPFAGAAHLELKLTQRGTRVYAYDAFEALVNCWKYVKKECLNIYREALEILKKVYNDKPRMHVMRDTFYETECPRQRAINFYLLNQASFNNLTLRNGGFSNMYMENNDVYRGYNKGKRRVFRPIEEDFFNPLFSIELQDFRVTLEKHADLPAYLDPPYPEVGEYYGDQPEHHPEFPHQELADILHPRKAPWYLSYNNTATVHRLYPPTDFHYLYPEWKSGMRKNHQSNEVFITPKWLHTDRGKYATISV